MKTHWKIFLAVLVVAAAGATYAAHSLWVADGSQEPARIEFKKGHLEGRLEDNLFSSKQKKAMIEFAYGALDGYLEGGEKAPPPKPELPDIKYSRLFVTFINDGKIRCCQSGSAKPGSKGRIEEDLKQAVERCIDDARFGGKIEQGELKDLDVVVDFLIDEDPIVAGTMKDMKDKIELGIHAVKIEGGKRSAIFKALVPIEKNYSAEQMFKRLCAKAKLPENCALNPNTKKFRYEGITFKGNREGAATDLYRGNVPLDVNSVSRDRVLKSIMMGYEWFLKNTDDATGRLHYQYMPSKNRHSKKTNHIRILASIWSASEVMKETNDKRAAALIKATLDYYLKNYRVKGRKGFYVKTDKRAPIANNAFLIMALINSPEYRGREKLMRGLADELLAQQRNDGKFITDFETGGEGGIDFYPGETILALMKLYEETGEAVYFEAAKRAFPYYRDYWRGNKNTAFVPWHTQVHLLMYKAEKNPEWAEFAFEMNSWLIDNDQLFEPAYPDLKGGFKRNPGNSTSSYAEGVCDAYALADLAGNDERAAKFLESCRLALKFVMQTQYTPDNVFYLKDGNRALGGFRKSLVDNSQRCDYTQHAILALMKAYRHGVFE